VGQKGGGAVTAGRATCAGTRKVAAPAECCGMSVDGKPLPFCFPHALWSIPRLHACSGCCCLCGFGPLSGTIPSLALDALRGAAVPAQCKSPAAPTPAPPAPAGISGGSGHLCFGTMHWLFSGAPALVGSAARLPLFSVRCGRSRTSSAARGTLPVPLVLLFLGGVVAEVPWLSSLQKPGRGERAG